jgi:C-terminal processing protease CtpA/Prc
MTAPAADAPAAATAAVARHREYEDFRVSSDGELHGVGLLIANEPYNNHLLVLGSIRGGPADRAGIVSGELGVL